jgi:hypothetical protein
MHGQLFQPSGTHSVDPGIIPDIAAVPTMLAKLEIVQMRSGPGLPKLVLGTVK